MKNQDSYSPQQVTRIINSYVKLSYEITRFTRDKEKRDPPEHLSTCRIKTLSQEVPENIRSRMGLSKDLLAEIEEVLSK